MNLINPDITGVVLAGGQSRRMGFNKAEALVSGESMLIRMINKLQEVTPNILVSIGSKTYPFISWPQISDEFPLCGPLGGIYSVMKISTTSLNLIVSCDIPLISISLLKFIVNKAEKSKALITVPVDHDGQLQMLCAVYHKDIIPILEKQINSNKFKLKDLLDLVPVQYINVSNEHTIYHEHAFKNVNTFTTLEQARKIWNNQKE